MQVPRPNPQPRIFSGWAGASRRRLYLPDLLRSSVKPILPMPLCDHLEKSSISHSITVSNTFFFKPNVSKAFVSSSGNGLCT